MDVKFSLVFPREPLSLGVMRGVLGDTLGALGVAPDCVSDILVAVTEACTNVVVHGGPARAYEVAARVGGSRCELDVVETGTRSGPRRNLRPAHGRRPAVHRPGLPRRVKLGTGGWLTWHANRPRGWADQGTSDPGPVSTESAPAESSSVAQLPESGRGLQIMEALVDEVRLRGGPGRSTCVSMQKELTWRSDAPLAALPGTGLRKAG